MAFGTLLKSLILILFERKKKKRNFLREFFQPFHKRRKTKLSFSPISEQSIESEAPYRLLHHQCLLDLHVVSFFTGKVAEQRTHLAVNFEPSGNIHQSRGLIDYPLSGFRVFLSKWILGSCLNWSF